MAARTEKLHVVSNGVDRAVTLYDSPQNSGSNTGLFFETSQGHGYPCCTNLGGTDTGLKGTSGSNAFSVYTEWASYSIKVPQTDNQTVTVTATHLGVATNYTGNFTAWHGDTFTAKVVASNNTYNAGTLNLTSGTFTGPATISATAATRRLFRFTITQSANQRITVTCGGQSYTESFDAVYGDSWTATIASTSNAYNAGSLSASSGTISGATSISASSATRKSYTFTITQSANQTITVKWTHDGSTSNKTATFTAYYGDTWTASIAPAANYTAGKLNATSGTVTGNVSVSAGAATLNAPANNGLESWLHSDIVRHNWTYNITEGENHDPYYLYGANGHFYVRSTANMDCNMRVDIAAYTGQNATMTYYYGCDNNGANTGWRSEWIGANQAGPFFTLYNGWVAADQTLQFWGESKTENNYHDYSYVVIRVWRYNASGGGNSYRQIIMPFGYDGGAVAYPGNHYWG